MQPSLICIAGYHYSSAQEFRIATTRTKGYPVGDYNINALGNRAFEHMSQALAIQEIAPGVTPFGEGPDGGREATFRGRMRYRTGEKDWQGYLVAQAKFRSRPEGDAVKDSAWTIGELKADLDKFLDAKRNLPKPEYYLLVTNVVLSAVQDAGGKDRVFAVLHEYAPKLGLKGYDVWDYDKLCRLLDAHMGVRTAYGDLVRAGDVLATFVAHAAGMRPDFEDVMGVFLQNALRADQFVRLEQAGNPGAPKTSLGSVFVDLRATSTPIADAPADESQAVVQLPPGIIAELLDAGSDVLRGSVIKVTQAAIHSGEGDEPPKQPLSNPGRFVIVGGPGQGKSTVGQFLCQLHRAAILSDRPSHKLSRESEEALAAFRVDCEATGTDLPLARRFPIRVVMDRFAAALARGEVRSLLSYMAAEITKVADRDCTVEDLRRWLGASPWLLVLDGLDEVPVTSNREAVLAKIADFWVEVANSDADVLVLATTRPQGYNQEFAPGAYDHRYLTPLSRRRALSYARRLVDVQHAADKARGERVMERMATALDQPATARLMRSPLQVTIMATLVDRVGQPPQERWRLFERYYGVIYDRETERDIQASRLLQQQRTHVDAIHRRVGLLLQVEGEREEQTEARLTGKRFGELARTHIEDQGYTGEELARRTREIVDAALARLVFLVGLEEDRVGFEVRSLQEFMAAAALMDGSDGQIRARLTAIAPVGYWRNTFLFAAGKCFVDRETLRDTIIAICGELNDSASDALGGATLAGSQLALDVLVEGVTREQPRRARALLAVALRLLELPDAALTTRLTAAYDPQFHGQWETALRDRLGQINLGHQLGAWGALRDLIAKGHNWARALADEYWPLDAEEGRRILAFGNLRSLEWELGKLAPLIPAVRPWKVDPLVRHTPPHLMRGADLPAWLPLLRKGLRKNSSEGQLHACLLPGSASLIYLHPQRTLAAQARGLHPFREFPFQHPAWAPLIAGAAFDASPEAATLAEQLRWLAEHWDAPNDPNAPHLVDYGMAWPLEACLAVSREREDLLSLARRAEAGELGSLDEWIRAETRWETDGIQADDLVAMTDERWPFDRGIAEVGFPFAVDFYYTHSATANFTEGYAALQEVFNALAAGKARGAAAELCVELLSSRRWREQSGDKIFLQPEDLKDLIAALPNQTRIPVSLLDGIHVPDPLPHTWVKLFEWWGEQGRGAIIDQVAFPQAAQLARHYTAGPQRRGLRHILALLALCGCRCPISLEVLNPQKEISDEYEPVDVLLLRLAQGGWNRNSVGQLASLANARLNDEPHGLWQATEVIQRQPIAPEEKQIFLLALRDQIHRTRPNALPPIISLLHAEVERRTSGLNDSAQRQRLGLPDLQ